MNATINLQGSFGNSVVEKEIFCRIMGKPSSGFSGFIAYNVEGKWRDSHAPLGQVGTLSARPSAVERGIGVFKEYEMTKSVRVVVLGVAAVVGMLACSDDALGGPFRRNRNCQTCCVTTTCCPTTTCCTTCQPTVRVARATTNCCSQVVVASAQTPAPQPMPSTPAQPMPQPAAQAPAAAPTTVAGPACTNCGTTTASCNVCCVPARSGIRRVNYSTCNSCCTTGVVTTSATTTTPAVAANNTCDPCNDCCVASARRFRIRR